MMFAAAPAFEPVVGSSTEARLRKSPDWRLPDVFASGHLDKEAGKEFGAE